MLDLAFGPGSSGGEPAADIDPGSTGGGTVPPEAKMADDEQEDTESLSLDPGNGGGGVIPPDLDSQAEADDDPGSGGGGTIPPDRRKKTRH